MKTNLFEDYIFMKIIGSIGKENQFEAIDELNKKYAMDILNFQNFNIYDGEYFTPDNENLLIAYFDLLAIDIGDKNQDELNIPNNRKNSFDNMVIAKQDRLERLLKNCLVSSNTE